MTTTAKNEPSEQTAGSRDPASRDVCPGPTRTGRKRRLALVLAIGVVAAGALAGLHVGPAAKTEIATPVTAPRPPAVVGLGYLEPQGSVIKVGAPGSPDALRIGVLKVREGDEVEAGQVLAVLDTFDRLTAQVEASNALLDLKRLLLERQQHEIVATVASRRSALERARAELSVSRVEFERQKTLLDRGVTTAATVEKRQRELLTAEATVRETEAALRRIEAQTQSRSAEPGALIDVAVTRQELAAAEADLKVAKASLELAIVRAPTRGRILSIKARAGERIGSDGVLEMGATHMMRAVIEVYQTDIGRVRVGQQVSIRADALAAPIGGRVERSSPVIKRQSVINNDPATATDARVVEVFVAFDDAVSREIASLSRLQVTAMFEP